MDLFNQDNELAVLSILVKNPDLVFSVNSLKPFMFSASPNQVIFTAIQDLASQNLKPELHLLINYLISKNKVKEAGGEEYLKYLSDQTFNSENLKAFVDGISNNYKARSIISATSDVAKKVNDGNINEYLSGLRHTIDSLEESSGGEQTADMLSATKETWEEIIARVEHPGIRGISTGLRDLDLIIGGFVETIYTIIASRPGMGKTASMVNLAMNVAKQEEPSLIFSLEMDKQSLVERMLAIKTSIPITDIRLGTLNQSQLNKISTAVTEIKDYPIYIDSNFYGNIDYVANTIRRFKKLKGIKTVFIDYVQLLAERGDNQTAELGKISRDVKLITNDLRISTVLYSQLSRSVEQRDDKRPILSDLRQSGNLEEDADIVIFPYRDEMYNKDTKQKGIMEWIIRKHRQGAIGSLFFKFDEETNKIWQG